VPDPNVRNLKNDKAQNPEGAKKKILILGSGPVVIGQATAKVDTSTRPPGGRMF
jgi:hypothetical protein